MKSFFCFIVSLKLYSKMYQFCNIKIVYYIALVFKSNENYDHFDLFFTVNISWLIIKKTIYINFTSLGNIKNT